MNRRIKKKLQLLADAAPCLKNKLKSCQICPRACGVNRLAGEAGFCKTGYSFKVASYNLHFGEEPCISGERGSGTIFFSNCNLGCVFCQNYPISHLGNGVETSADELSGIMLKLQKMGAHNINFVTPSHIAPQLAGALLTAYKNGLSIPLVYNSNGYESLDVIKMFEGIIDIYLPDAKYSSSGVSLKYSNSADYHSVNIGVLKEMFRQAGRLKVDASGVAQSGLMIRHLVLPGQYEDSIKTLESIAGEVSADVSVSIMAQYHPAYKAVKDSSLNRTVSAGEYSAVLKKAEELSLINGYRQEL